MKILVLMILSFAFGQTIFGEEEKICIRDSVGVFLPNGEQVFAVNAGGSGGAYFLKTAKFYPFDYLFGFLNKDGSYTGCHFTWKMSTAKDLALRILVESKETKGEYNNSRLRVFDACFVGAKESFVLFSIMGALQCATTGITWKKELDSWEKGAWFKKPDFVYIISDDNTDKTKSSSEKDRIIKDAKVFKIGSDVFFMKRFSKQVEFWSFNRKKLKFKCEWKKEIKQGTNTSNNNITLTPLVLGKEKTQDAKAVFDKYMPDGDQVVIEETVLEGKENTKSKTIKQVAYWIKKGEKARVRFWENSKLFSEDASIKTGSKPKVLDAVVDNEKIYILHRTGTSLGVEALLKIKKGDVFSFAKVGKTLDFNDSIKNTPASSTGTGDVQGVSTEPKFTDEGKIICIGGQTFFVIRRAKQNELWMLDEKKHKMKCLWINGRIVEVIDDKSVETSKEELPSSEKTEEDKPVSVIQPSTDKTNSSDEKKNGSETSGNPFFDGKTVLLFVLLSFGLGVLCTLVILKKRKK